MVLSSEFSSSRDCQPATASARGEEPGSGEDEGVSCFTGPDGDRIECLAMLTLRPFAGGATEQMVREEDRFRGEDLLGGGMRQDGDDDSDEEESEEVDDCGIANDTVVVVVTDGGGDMIHRNGEMKERGRDKR